MADDPAANAEEKRLVTGSLWIGAAQAIVSLGTLASGILAARVLSKRDLGLMGIALLATALLDQLSQSGFDKALVQREKDVEGYLNTGWTWNVIRGLALATILCAAAYPLSLWYDEPALLPVIAVTSTAPLLMGLSNVGTVFFSRQLDFRRIFLIRGIQAVSTVGVAIPAILILKSVWALVIAHVSGALALLIISYLSHPYRPRFELSRDKLRELVRYGKWLTATNAMVFVVTQGDDLFVSKYLGLVSLAFYQLAYQLANLPTTHVSHVIAQSTFPTYARLQRETKRLRAAFLQVMRGVLLFSGPVSVFLVMMIPYLVAHVVGPSWEPIIPLVQILVIGGFLRSFLSLAGPLFQAVGRTDLDFKMNVPRTVVIVGLIWPACALYGLAGASALVVLSLIAIVPWWFMGVRHIIGLRVGDVLRENVLAVLSSVAMALTLWGFRTLFGPGFGAMFATAGGGIALWLVLLWLLGRLSPRLDFFGDLRRLRATLQ